MTALEIRLLPGQRGNSVRRQLLRSSMWVEERASDRYYMFYAASGWGHFIRGRAEGPDNLALWCPLPPAVSRTLQQ